LSSVVSRTRTHLSAEKFDISPPYCRNTKVGDKINSFLQHLPEPRHLDQQELINRVMATNTKYFAEFKPSSVPQVSAGQRKREKDKGTKLGNDNNSRPGSCTMTPDKSTNQRSTGTPPTVLDKNSVNKPSSLGPCAEAKGSLLKDVQDKSSSGPRARAVSHSNKLTADQEYLGSPRSSFHPSWEKERTRVCIVGSGSHARAVGLNNKPTGINPAALGQNRVNQNSSLGPCAEAECWIDKSISGVKRKDDRKSDD